MDKRYHIFYSGMVQGVGFRFTARYLANRHSIKGWVKNVPDGRVEIEAEGDPQNLGLFLGDLKAEFSRNISDYDIEEFPASGEYRDFQVVF